MSVVIRSMKKWPWAFVFGFAAVASYAAFAGISIKLFPYKLTPPKAFISILGMSIYNPEGAVFYNSAMVLCGLFGIPFFIALFAYYSRIQRDGLWVFGLAAGIINGAAVAMAGVFAEDVNREAHLNWSYLIFLSLIPMLIADNAAFWKMKGLSRLIGAYELFACAIDGVFVAMVIRGGLRPGSTSVLEWCAIIAYLVWVAFVSVDVLRRSRAS